MAALSAIEGLAVERPDLRHTGFVGHADSIGGEEATEGVDRRVGIRIMPIG
jgi:hypothetical protein